MGRNFKIEVTSRTLCIHNFTHSDLHVFVWLNGKYINIYAQKHTYLRAKTYTKTVSPDNEAKNTRIVPIPSAPGSFPL